MNSEYSTWNVRFFTNFHLKFRAHCSATFYIVGHFQVFVPLQQGNAVMSVHKSSWLYDHVKRQYSLDISSLSYWLHSGKSHWNCWFQSSSSLVTEIRFAWTCISPRVVLRPVSSQTGPLMIHPSRVLTAYWPSPILVITCQGSIALGALVQKAVQSLPLFLEATPHGGVATCQHPFVKDYYLLKQEWLSGKMYLGASESQCSPSCYTTVLHMQLVQLCAGLAGHLPITWVTHVALFQAAEAQTLGLHCSIECSEPWQKRQGLENACTWLPVGLLPVLSMGLFDSLLEIVAAVMKSLLFPLLLLCNLSSFNRALCREVLFVT